MRDRAALGPVQRTPSDPAVVREVCAQSTGVGRGLAGIAVAEGLDAVGERGEDPVQPALRFHPGMSAHRRCRVNRSSAALPGWALGRFAGPSYCAGAHLIPHAA
jgi:hypothetical protein